jgi:hypothetical protein
MIAATHIEQEELASASKTAAKSSPLRIDDEGVQPASDPCLLAEAWRWLESPAGWEVSDIEDLLPGLL